MIIRPDVLTLGSRPLAALFSPAVMTLAVLTTGIAVLSWHEQQDPARAALLFLLLASLTVGTATNIAGAAFSSDSALDRSIAAAVIGFAVVAACGLVFGALRVIGIGSYIAAAAALFVWSLRWTTHRDDAASEWARPPAPVVGAIGALLALAAAYSVTHAPLTLYDSLSYHLFFPEIGRAHV